MSVNLLLSFPLSICLPISVSLSCIQICLSFLLSVRFCIFTHSPLICIYFIRFYVCVCPCVPVCAFTSLSISPTQLVSSSARTLQTTGQMSNLCASLSVNATVRISHIWLTASATHFRNLFPICGFKLPGLSLPFKVCWLKSVCEEGSAGVTFKAHLELPRSFRYLCVSRNTIVGMDRAQRG